jgi:hypothetical protein
MLKNKVIEKTGINAYAIFSDEAASKLKLEHYCNPLIPHTETYEHIGEVKIHVHNLRTAWQNYLEEKQIIVNPDNAWIKFEFDVPFPPSIIWDYVSTPELEAPLLGLLSVKRIDTLGGRTRPGANFHCAHSSADFFNLIVDWKPFHYYTTFQSGVAGLEYYRTIRLEYDGKITRFFGLVSQPQVEPPKEITEFFNTVVRQSFESIPVKMQSDFESGKFTL